MKAWQSDSAVMVERTMMIKVKAVDEIFTALEFDDFIGSPVLIGHL